METSTRTSGVREQRRVHRT